jgi:hypothetical protein
LGHIKIEGTDVSEVHRLARLLPSENAHKHEDTAELRDQIRGAMKDEVPGVLA